jgi:hypothetical protein
MAPLLLLAPLPLLAPPPDEEVPPPEVLPLPDAVHDEEPLLPHPRMKTVAPAIQMSPLMHRRVAA